MRRTAVAVLACVLLAGCGTTTTPLDAAQAQDPMGVPRALVSADPVGGPPAGRTSVSSVGVGGGLAPSGLPAPGADGGRLPTSTPVSAGAIQVGVPYSDDQGPANAALGAGGLDSGDARRYFDAVIAEMNAAGGVLGRRIKPVYFGFSTGAQSSAELEQSACDYWTRDHHVFAVLGASGETLRECTRRAGVLHLWTGFSTSISSTFRSHPQYVEVSSINLERGGAVTVDGLSRTDYFAGTPKIGLVTWDDPVYRHALRHGWERALTARGRTVAETAYVSVPSTAGALSESSASVSNAILRFKARGITHVMMADGPAGVFGGTGLTLLWLKAAAAQRYYPRYGFNSANSPVSGYRAGLWGADDIRGARAVLWGDGDDEADEGLRRNARRVACMATMRRAGIELDNANASGTALSACDLLWFLRASLIKGDQTVSLQAALAGVTAMGRTYRSPMAYATRFDAQRRDGTAAVRLTAFVDPDWDWLGKPYPTD